MLQQREGKQARIQDLCIHLQTAYRHWQRGKPDQFAAELDAAHVLVGGTLSNDPEAFLIKDNLNVVQAAAEKNQSDLVVGALARALSRAEKMLRRGI